MRVYLARHAQTNYNVSGICNADPSVDVHLTETGIAQAAELAEKLKDANFNHVFISELKRTKQTADIVNKYHSAPITVDPRLNDNRSGFENRPNAEFIAAWEAATDKWNARFNDGESFEDLKTRVREFIDDLKGLEHESALIVTSMTVVQAFNGIVNNLTNEQAWEEFPVDNASCLVLELN